MIKCGLELVSRIAWTFPPTQDITYSPSQLSALPLWILGQSNLTTMEVKSAVRKVSFSLKIWFPHKFP